MDKYPPEPRENDNPLKSDEQSSKKARGPEKGPRKARGPRKGTTKRPAAPEKGPPKGPIAETEEEKMEDLLQVGIITSTHGIKGEVKVYPTTDDINRFKKLKHVVLDTKKEKIELEIEQVKFFKQYAILKFKGIDDINDIEKYKKMSIYVTRENAVKLKKDEYFIADLIGLKVINEDETYFGELKDVISTGANDVYVIETNENGEVLIPAIKDCILSVDMEERLMKIHLLKGLI